MSSPPLHDDVHWMRLAMAQARLAADRGEVPIGAVVVLDGRLVAAAHDGKEIFGDPTAHAEVLAMRRAAEELGDWRLLGATLYVTLEPCAMCAGAMIHARIARLVYAAPNARWGACSPPLSLLEDPRWNHAVKVETGVLAEESAALLRAVFKRYRE